MVRSIVLGLLAFVAGCSTEAAMAGGVPAGPAGSQQSGDAMNGQQPGASPDPSMQVPNQPATGMQNPPMGQQPTTPAGMDGTAGGGATMPPEMPGNPGSGRISSECQGLDFEGMVYSPGGNTSPNSCEPFHPTANNPYAVRCIDAWPWYATRFPGDEMCILPPPPEQGVQYGVHPQGRSWFEDVSQGDMSGYESPAMEFVMQPGQETELNYYTSAENPARSFYRNHVRMRAGSHHMIVSAGTGDASETWGLGSPEGLFVGTRLPGAQRIDQNTPETLEKPAEDAGLYIDFPASPSITFNMHHFNSTGQPILREAWANIWWEDDATVPVVPMRGLGASTLLMAIPPGGQQDFHYSYTITQETRLLSLFGHRHAWTPNFSAWIEKPSGETEIVYQSFDWFDQPSYRYDSAVQNPAPAPELRADGGSTGVKMLQPGERFHFNCHVTYTNERAASEGAPTPGEVGTLHFANQAYTGEMCILFGETAGIGLPLLVEETSPLPDFATLE